MGKTRIVNLAKELKMEVRELIQRLKDDLGLQENFTYLSSLDEATVARARQVISAAVPQVEELRVGDNIKRRRRVAPAPAPPMEPPPEQVPEAEAAPPPPPKEEAKPRKPKETVARVVSLPPKGKAAAAKAPARRPAAEPPMAEAVTPAAPPEIPEAATAAPPLAPPKKPAPADSATALKRQRGKAKKKEVPARIISLPAEKPPAPVSVAPEQHRGAAERPAFRPGARTAGGRPAAPAARSPWTCIWVMAIFRNAWSTAVRSDTSCGYGACCWRPG